jgi:hypothetical protein
MAPVVGRARAVYDLAAVQEDVPVGSLVLACPLKLQSGNGLALEFSTARSSVSSEVLVRRRPVLYAHGEMYGLVTVTQGSRYMSNAVTHPRCIFWTANFTKAAQIGPKYGFPGDLCA